MTYVYNTLPPNTTYLDAMCLLHVYPEGVLAEQLLVTDGALEELALAGNLVTLLMAHQTPLVAELVSTRTADIVLLTMLLEMGMI